MKILLYRELTQNFCKMSQTNEKSTSSKNPYNKDINSKVATTPQSSSTSSQSISERHKYIAAFNAPFCEDVSKYTKISKIGQGTFG